MLHGRGANLFVCKGAMAAPRCNTWIRPWVRQSHRLVEKINYLT